MTKYTKATLHANGEKQDFATAEDAKRLRAAFEGNYFVSSDGNTEYGISNTTSAFVALTIDKTATALDPKPNCDNYGQCPPTPVKGALVTVKYVDETAPTVDISTGQTISGNVGDSYSTQQKTITGYTFKSVQGSKTGTITSTAQTVTYIYTKNP